MPAKSQAQAKLMRAVAHNPKFAKKVGIPTKVGEDFTSATSLADLHRLPAHVENAKHKRKKKPSTRSSY